jgi:hypothetical protein
MDMPRDELQRELREIDDAHDASMPQLREATSRLLDPSAGITADQKRRAIIGGLGRRGFLRIGGATVLGGAVLAACGDDDDDDAATATTAGGAGTTASTAAGTETTMGGSETTAGGTETTAGGDASADVVILRTAASIENLAVAAYQMAVDSGNVTDQAVADAALLFQAHHVEHADFWNAMATQAGGEAFTDPNPALLEALGPDIEAALTSQAGIVGLAYQLEVVAAQTYLNEVGGFEDVNLDKAFMSVSGVEARHAMVLANVLAYSLDEAFPQGFLGIAMAVAAGTGVE